MAAPTQPHTVEHIDQAIATAHAQITWRSPADRLLIRAVIDELLDQRNQLTHTSRINR